MTNDPSSFITPRQHCIIMGNLRFCSGEGSNWELLGCCRITKFQKTLQPSCLGYCTAWPHGITNRGPWLDCIINWL